MVPETWQGKIIASFCALLGISFFALPAVSCGSRVIFKNSNTHPGAYKKLFKTSTRRVYYGGEELAYQRMKPKATFQHNKMFTEKSFFPAL